jgi:nitrilase
MALVAAIQMNSGSQVDANLMEVERLLATAAAAGAGLAVLPENFALMGRHTADQLEICEAEGDGPIQTFLARQAVRHRLWLVAGTLPLKATTANKVRAACLVFDPQGRQVARYDKLHLFDVQLVDHAESYHESATIEPGTGPVVVDTPLGRLGLAICYDLRFPELFRALSLQGMDLLALPAAFTAVTGRAHWEPLLRARAIENLCYVIAAGQSGYHANGRETYGDSMVVDPWGVIVERLSQGSGVVLSRLERNRLENIRRQFPVLQHRRRELTPELTPCVPVCG